MGQHTQNADLLLLSDDELAFLRYTCELFPAPESPLKGIEEHELAPEAVERLFQDLTHRGVLAKDGSGLVPALRERITPVAECSARVLLTARTAGGRQLRSYYVHDGHVVEHRRSGTSHGFGPVRPESHLSAEIAKAFRTAPEGLARILKLSASDYLVFAVFARDLRDQREAAPDGSAPMSIDEVLAYFDEPESKTVKTPSDDNWQASVTSLANQRVLVKRADGYALHPTLHPVAREIVADHQHNVVRFDFLDDQWLVRELSLYPTDDCVYRLGTDPDGSVVIQELSDSALKRALTGVVRTLPTLLSHGGGAHLKAPT